MSNIAAVFICAAVITAWKGDDYWHNHEVNLVILYLAGIVGDTLNSIIRNRHAAK